jgi:hypothetical protein
MGAARLQQGTGFDGRRTAQFGSQPGQEFAIGAVRARRGE